jgi:hypothetical protein
MVSIFTWLCVNLNFPISLIALSWNQFYFRKNYDFVSIISYDRKIETTMPMHKKRKEKKRKEGKEMYRLNKGIKEQTWFVNHVMKLSYIMWICEVAHC